MSVQTSESAHSHAAHFALQGVAGAYLGVFLSVTSAQMALTSPLDFALYFFVCFYPLTSLFVMALLSHSATPTIVWRASVVVFWLYTLVFSTLCLVLFFLNSATLSEDFSNNIVGNLTIVGIFCLWFSYILIFDVND